MATRDVSDVVQNALDDDVVFPFFVIELLFDSAPLRLWTGVGTLVFEGVTYTGTGSLLDVSSIEETSEIAVRGATITLSGINSEVISLALQSPYQGRVCNISFGLFARGNLLQEDGAFILLEDGSKIPLESGETGLTQIFSGYMDEMNIDEGAELSTIQLKVENRLIDLERARVRRYSSGYQKSAFPGDKGFDFVEDLQDKEIVWGRSVNRG
jgi:hypothetical protein